MSFKNILKNEEAVSISVGFILMFSITIIVFSTTILAFYALMLQSEKASMRESFEIQGSGHTIRITTIDTVVYISSSYGGWVNNLEYEFSIPAKVAGEAYTTGITDKQIVLESESGARAWVPFNSISSITGQEIYSNAQDYKLTYNKTYNTIKIEKT